ncbi:MAG: PEP-CTERM sorting domain-containing protein [Planctomycetes bacterium]|nr:PEP-CTERM sorting domain-containing protein [Planctomycetota bacterium]
MGGSLSGAFSGLAEGGLVGNFGSTNLLITYLGGDGNDVTLLATLPGDFDIDVDGFDFLKWQRGFGTIYDATDLADWEANYGAVAPLAAASTAVPEPSSSALLLTVLLCVTFRRRS